MSRSPSVARRFGTLVIALILAAALGCGGRSTYPVRGKVVFPDGTPLPGGRVIAEPTDATHQVSARGEIQPDGTFELGTFTDNDGALEGEHHVLITPPEDLVIVEGKPRRPSIDKRFKRFETSELKIVVTRDPGKNNFTLTVKKP
jgi:hypothetical protein